MSETTIILETAILTLFLLEFLLIKVLLNKLNLVNDGIGGAIGALGQEIFAIREHLDSLNELVPNVNLIHQSNPLVDLISAWKSITDPDSSSTSPAEGRDESGRFTRLDEFAKEEQEQEEPKEI